MAKGTDISCWQICLQSETKPDHLSTVDLPEKGTDIQLIPREEQKRSRAPENSFYDWD